MKIDSTAFGSITIDGETYFHDVIIRLSGKAEKRKKKLSKKIFGTSHTMSLDEAEFIYEKGADLLILGTGQYGNLRLLPKRRGSSNAKTAKFSPSRRLKPLPRSTGRRDTR